MDRTHFLFIFYSEHFEVVEGQVVLTDHGSD